MNESVRVFDVSRVDEREAVVRLRSVLGGVVSGVGGLCWTKDVLSRLSLVRLLAESWPLKATSLIQL